MTKFCFFEKNRPRPEFAIRSSTVEKNPVTGILEPYFSSVTRRYRIITGVITLSVMVDKSSLFLFFVKRLFLFKICIVIIFIIAIIIYRVIIIIPLFQSQDLR